MPGLFVWPEGGPKEWEHLKTVLDGMGADEHVRELASCTRLPGGWRFDDEGYPVTWQRLYYLDPGALDAGKGSSFITHPGHKADPFKSDKEQKALDCGDDAEGYEF